MTNDPGTLAPLLDDAWRAAREAWRGVDVAFDRFSAHVIQRLPGSTAADVALARVATSDLYLACACADGDPTALAAFEADVLDVVAPALQRMRVDPDVVSEVAQRIRRNLLVADGKVPTIAQYAGRGDLRGWVRVIAVREALALARETRSHQPLSDDALARIVSSDADPETAYLKATYRDEFRRAFEQAVVELDDRDRLLLRQQFVDGLTIDDIASAYHVHRATAARWLEAARERLATRTRALIRERLGVRSAEVNSILRLIRSRVQVSIGGLLRRRRQGRKAAS
jgi:RNA polymerase sigma-70 factor, ECF subfamily